MKKKLVALLVAGSLFASAMTPAVAWAGVRTTGSEETVLEEEDAAEAVTEEEAVEVADNAEILRSLKPMAQIGRMDERKLREETGMSLAEWDAAIAKEKEAGLAEAFTEESLLAADPETEILKEKEAVYFISGSGAFEPVMDVMDAYRLLYRLLPVLGGNEETNLLIWNKLQVDDTYVYSFQQIADSETVLGSTVKIAVDGSGAVNGVFSGLNQESREAEHLATQQEAEEAVIAQIEALEGKTAELLPDETDRIIYSPWDKAEALNLDDEATDPVPEIILWVVYTKNDSGDAETEEEYPYTAHYVNLDGTYRFCLGVESPGSEEALNGWRKQEIFAGMTADSWRGEVKDVLGRKRIITVPVMKCEEDGLWYLGDVDRRIAVADFATAAYGENHEYKLVSSETNEDWDNEDLLMFFNYIRAWDFYRDRGWTGPDGDFTDVVILKGLCTSSGASYENACSVGMVECEQLFGYTPYAKLSDEPLGLVNGLDVMAHEYTHTFTSTVMNSNLYLNDMGAINEAMSDIFGNLIEYLYEDTADQRWNLGENTGMLVRCMSDPHDHSQPEYVWDVFYGAPVEERTDANDNGGVHYNSSLLNLIAASLCLDYGMSYEDAITFWLTVAMGMTPQTNYVQMETLLSWALERAGMDEWQEALSELTEATQLSRTEIPEMMPKGQKIVKLALPETEALEDKNWALAAFQINPELLEDIEKLSLELLLDRIFGDEEEKQLEMEDVLQMVIDRLELDEVRLTSEDLEDEDKMLDKLTEILVATVKRLIVQHLGWRSGEDGEITQAMYDGYALYVLLNVAESGTKIQGAAVLAGDKWLDVGLYMEIIQKAQSLFGGQSEDPLTDIKELGNLVAEALNERLDAYLRRLEKQGDEEIVEAEEEDTDAGEILTEILKVVQYLAMDEEERPSSEEYFAVPTVIEYLPTEGLEKVRLTDALSGLVPSEDEVQTE